MKKLFLTVALTVFFASRSAAMPEIMPLEKVQSGMKGTAYTIIDNTGVIEPFDVKIIGLMDNGKGSSRMIMATASGKVIEKTGGVLQGMSGSPVYIDGKLIGALAAGLKEMSPYTFFITPIESMLKIWELPDDKTLNPTKKKFRTKNEELLEKVIQGEEKSLVYFSGFDQSGLKFLEREMKPFGFENFFAISTSARNEIKYDAKLEPGSAIGVAVVCGDFLVGATGTVTAVDNKRILGFGHAFTHGGNVNFFMTDSSVIGSVSGENGSGVKVASVGNIIGRINQDREAGVAGVLGHFPSFVPITVKVKDNSRGKTETYHATIAYNESLVPKLGAAIAYTALSKTADSTAESTVAVDFGIKTNVVEGGVLSRQNMFYSAADVGQFAVGELLAALNLVCSNTTEASDILGIEVNMTLDTERKTATLVSAVPDKDLVKPGETVNLTVTMQPYRKPEEKYVVPYTVPLTAKEGALVLDLHGGAFVPVNQASSGGISPSRGTPAQNYNEKIKTLLNAGKNNQLVVELGAVNAPKNQKELKQEMKRLKKVQARIEKLGLKPQASTNKFDTKYIIDNIIQVTVNVDKL